MADLNTRQNTLHQTYIFNPRAHFLSFIFCCNLCLSFTHFSFHKVKLILMMLQKKRKRSREEITLDNEDTKHLSLNQKADSAKVFSQIQKDVKQVPCPCYRFLPNKP